MPVTPSFSAYAKTPDLAGAYIGAQRNQVQRENIAADAAAAANRIAVQREQIAAAAVQNQMELEAKKEIYAKQAMQRSQEAEIQKAYHETQFGLKERELQREESIAAMRIQEAARGFDQRMAYQRRREELLPTLGDQKASEQAMREYGFGEGGFGTAVGRAAQKEPPMSAATKSQIKLMEQDIGEQRRELLKTDDQEEQIKIQGKINKLTGRLQKMFPMEPPSALPVAPSQPQQWQTNPDSLPYGAPGDPQIYMGPQQYPQHLPNVPMAPQATNTTQSLKILSVRRK